MDKLTELADIIDLLDCYRPLLTPHQQEIATLYFEENLSYGEIATQLQTSRTAAYAAVKRLRITLENCETKLGLLQRRSELIALMNDAYDHRKTKAQLADDIRQLIVAQREE